MRFTSSQSDKTDKTQDLPHAIFFTRQLIHVRAMDFLQYTKMTGHLESNIKGVITNAIIRYEFLIDHRSCTHNLSSYEIKAGKFNLTTAQVVCLTAMINHKFISFSAVQIYDLSYVHLQWHRK